MTVQILSFNNIRYIFDQPNYTFNFFFFERLVLSLTNECMNLNYFRGFYFMIIFTGICEEHTFPQIKDALHAYFINTFQNLHDKHYLYLKKKKKTDTDVETF